MGLDSNGTKFLLYARQCGVSFEKTAMVGRQKMSAEAETLHENLSRFGFGESREQTDRILTAAGGYAEPFLEILGAEEVLSFDASDYENATNIHDFNAPIPEEFKNRFSVVLDGGTLEHIFNFPVAIQNCMEMCRVGGHFLGITPTNNFLGHGFYQFSPELFYRLFTPENGFEMKKMIFFEDFPASDWYEVADPDAVKERVTLVNRMPAYLLIIAEKTKSVPIFARPPQQSDYQSMWIAGAEINQRQEKNPQNLLLQQIRAALKPVVEALRRKQRQTNQTRSLLNHPRQHFKKIDLPDKRR